MSEALNLEKGLERLFASFWQDNERGSRRKKFSAYLSVLKDENSEDVLTAIASFLATRTVSSPPTIAEIREKAALVGRDRRNADAHSQARGRPATQAEKFSISRSIRAIWDAGYRWDDTHGEFRPHADALPMRNPNVAIALQAADVRAFEAGLR